MDEQILKRVELFSGLSNDELKAVADICQERRLHPNEVIARQGEPGDEFYIITTGFVEIVIEGKPEKVIVNLGKGQSVGEMSLIDQGPRSATVRAVSDPTIVQTITQADFEKLCNQDTRIGYVVMHNIAADLSFKLRQRHLSESRR